MENPSVIAIVKGGLGNQLFIYAAARALALRTGRRLYLDARRGYTSDSYGRSYRLDRFPIAAEPMPEEWRIAPTLRHPRHKIIRAWNKCLPRNLRGYLAERHHLDASQLTALDPAPNRVTLLGYWQNEDYFADHAETIRRELAPPEPGDARNLELGRDFTATETVSLHIRRVQYAHRLEKDYYQTAINEARASIQDPRFAVFGDDLAWPRAMLDFGGTPVEFVSHNTDDELADLWLMASCRHAIVANSSFSWWGAWLGPAREGRRIFFPTQAGWPIHAARDWRTIPNTLENDPS